MKRFLLFAALAACVNTSVAADRATELLEGLASGFRSMKSYGVSFTVVAGEHTSRGSYSVAGESYYLTLADAEVFCDGKLRYEVDRRRREITITEVDAASRNILNNPVRAFDFLGSEYAATLLWERDGKAAIRLTPAAGNKSASGQITVTVSTSTMRPLSLSYDYDGERIDVSVSGVEPLATPLKAFDKGAYGGYELIDFR